MQSFAHAKSNLNQDEIRDRQTVRAHSRSRTKGSARRHSMRVDRADKFKATLNPHVFNRFCILKTAFQWTELIDTLTLIFSGKQFSARVYFGKSSRLVPIGARQGQSFSCTPTHRANHQNGVTPLAQFVCLCSEWIATNRFDKIRMELGKSGHGVGGCGALEWPSNYRHQVHARVARHWDNAICQLRRQTTGMSTGHTDTPWTIQMWSAMHARSWPN